MLDKQLEPAISRTCAWAELVGYAGNISLNLLRLQMLDQSIYAMHRALEQSEPDGWVRLFCLPAGAGLLAGQGADGFECSFCMLAVLQESMIHLWVASRG